LSDITDQKSDVTDTAAPAEKPETAGPSRRRRTGTGLQAMLLPELQTLASSLGISGTARMRKGELIAAIQTNQGVTGQLAAEVTGEAQRGAPDQRAAESATKATKATKADHAAEQPVWEVRPGEDTLSTTQQGATRTESRTRRATRPAGPPQPRERAAAVEPAVGAREAVRDERVEELGLGQEIVQEPIEQVEQPVRAERTERPVRERREQTDRGQRGNQRTTERPARGERADELSRDAETPHRGERPSRFERDGEGDGDEDRRGRRSRFRDRRGRRNERGEGGEREQQFTEDDVLIPVAGIVDVLDSYAFVRTTGYLSGPNDVYVSMSQVRKYGLRRGDAVTGAVRLVRDGEQRRD
jgi:transcription termination factor Rho